MAGADRRPVGHCVQPRPLPQFASAGREARRNPAPQLTTRHSRRREQESGVTLPCLPANRSPHCRVDHSGAADVDVPGPRRRTVSRRSAMYVTTRKYADKGSLIDGPVPWSSMVLCRCSDARPALRAIRHRSDVRGPGAEGGSAALGERAVFLMLIGAPGFRGYYTFLGEREATRGVCVALATREHAMEANERILPRCATGRSRRTCRASWPSRQRSLPQLRIWEDSHGYMIIRHGSTTMGVEAVYDAHEAARNAAGLTDGRVTAPQTVPTTSCSC